MRILLMLMVMVVTAAGAEAQTPRYWNLLFAVPAPIKADSVFPQVFTNDAAAWVSVRSVACFVQGGTVTILPTLTGGNSTSVLREPLVCVPEKWTSGRINGRPQVRSFATNGATCEALPCTMDLKIEKVEGAPTYLIIKLVGR